MTKKINRTNFYCFALFVFLLSFFNVIINAQSNISTDGFTPKFLTPGAPAGSYPLSGMDNVNLFNGHLNFSLSLAKIVGRGDIKTSLVKKIERKWRVTRHEDISYAIHEPDENWWDVANFEPGYGPGVLIGRKVTEVNCVPSPTRCYNTSITRLTFISPDGTEFELRDQLHEGQPKDSEYYYGTPPSRGTVFVTADGTSATFVSNTTITDSTGSMSFSMTMIPSGYLLLRDGSRYDITNGLVTKMRDRNGNETHFTYDVNNRVETITDSNGRVTEIEYDVADSAPYGTCDHIKFKGSGGTQRIVRVSKAAMGDVLIAGDTIKTYVQLFNDLPGNSMYSGFGPEVVSSIWLPDGTRRYKFYYNSYGELARVELPTGGAFEYDYPTSSGAFHSGTAWGSDIYDIYRPLLEKRIYSAGGTGNTYDVRYVYNTNFNHITSETDVTIDTKLSNGSLINRAKHYFYGTPFQNTGVLPTVYPRWKQGREYKTEIYDSDGTTLLKRFNKTWFQTSPSWWGGTADNAPTNNSRITEDWETLADTNQVSKKEYSYDSFNNITDTYVYDWGNGTAGSFLHRSHIDYVTDTNYTLYTGSHLRSLPTQSWVSSDSSGTNIVSRTQIEYDNYSSDSRHAPLVSRSSVVGHDSTNFGTGFVRRGNPTQTVSFGNASAQTDPVYTSIQYDILGNPVKTIDANGNASLIYYNDNFGAPNAEARTNSAPGQLSGNSTFGFPTSVVNQAGWTTYAQFDYFTGAVVDVEDIHGNVSSSFYNDALDRPTQGILANNTGLKQQTTIVYDDANHRIQKTSDLFTYGDNLAKTESFYDGLGRTFENRLYRDGTYVISLTEFDQLGRIKRVTNPYKTSESQLWTTTTYDALSRPLTVTSPDNAVVTSAYSGSIVTITDQAGKQRRSISNSIGQLMRVDEPDDGGSLGTVSSPNQATGYVYDVLGNLVQVNQGVQQRNFTYDSLSRLRQAQNPESGTISYNYDANGNLTQKTDARSVVTSYTYDGLNRMTQRSYSDGTPTVSYTYDDIGISYSKGKLTEVASSISETRYTSFDNLGRVLTSQQETDGNTFNFSYSYSLAGQLLEEIYPSGRKVKNTFESDGDLGLVETQIGGGSWQGRVGNITYTSHLGISSLQLGNGRWENTVYNSRLQATQLGLGTAFNDQSLWKVNYDYGTTNNNGNVLQQVVTVPGVFAATQDYTYDTVNRLKSATEAIGGSQTWKQTYTFDRYGNRRFDTTGSNTTTIPGGCSTDECNPTIDVNNNRFTNGQGYSYDASGNLTVDTQNRAFYYDGENKQKEVRDASNNIIGQYYYDGDGKRVKKAAAHEITLFVYDASGKMTSEYTVTTSSPSSPVTSYLTNDTLGSPRITTDASGNVVSRRDFRPYGEEIGRTGYGSDSLRQKFTGYERDIETDLDFAQARMYGYSLGRFTSPDPLSASANSIRPQSWNRYTYSYNSPLRFTDPSGMIAGDYYDLNGNFLGTDDRNDELVYIVYDNDKSKKLEDRKKIEIPDAKKVIPAIIESYNKGEKPTADYPKDAKKGGFHEEAVVVDIVDGKTEIKTYTGSYVPDPTSGAHVTTPVTENTKLKSHTHPSGEKTSDSDAGSSVFVDTTSTAQFTQIPSARDIENALPNGTNITVAAREKRVYFYSTSGNDSKCRCIAQMSLKNFMKIGGK